MRNPALGRHGVALGFALDGVLSNNLSSVSKYRETVFSDTGNQSYPYSDKKTSRSLRVLDVSENG
jgi:hypothetical protein